MPLFSPSTRGFYREDIHGKNVPADAIKITTKQHREFVLAQSQGHTIVTTPAGPVVRYAHTDRDAVLAAATKRVKNEARRRILRIASLARQANDNAALALAALGEGDSTVSAAARERRHKIDAVREASNRIESALEGYTVSELAAFNAATAAWPE